MENPLKCPNTHNQDVAVHFMSDSRWENDTLFLVFEEDFRFEEDSCGGSHEPIACDSSQRPLQPVELGYHNKVQHHSTKRATMTFLVPGFCSKNHHKNDQSVCVCLSVTIRPCH